MPCHAHAALLQNGMVMAWHGRGMGAAWNVRIKHGRTV
jgi:hypothetical protein